jgi:hypothetical protein
MARVCNNQQIGKGNYFPSFVEARRTSDKALIAGSLAWSPAAISSTRCSAVGTFVSLTRARASGGRDAAGAAFRLFVRVRLFSRRGNE